MDLQPGWQLKIVVPSLTSGKGYQVAFGSEKTYENTIVLSASNLAGYEVSYYAVQRRRSGRVQLRFTSAAVTKNGQMAVEQNAPRLPFILPDKPSYVRLIYLVRSSQSDHNMAVLASKSIAALDAFTERLKSDGSVCSRNGQIFCSWVPAGTAVRPERLAPPE